LKTKQIGWNKILTRFYNSTPKKFLKKVYSYEKILPKKLCKDLIRYSINPNNKPSDKSRPCGVNKVISANVNSKIVSNKHII